MFVSITANVFFQTQTVKCSTGIQQRTKIFIRQMRHDLFPHRFIDAIFFRKDLPLNCSFLLETRTPIKANFLCVMRQSVTPLMIENFEHILHILLSQLNRPQKPLGDSRRKSFVQLRFSK